MIAEARVGTSGFAYREWIGNFYPQNFAPAQMLPYYAQRLNAVEVSSSLSRIWSAEGLAAWKASVPAGFQFALRLPNRISQDLRLVRANSRSLAAFLEAAEELGENLGPLLVQVPPAMPADRRSLGEFLRALPVGLRVAFEFQHPSWREEATLRVLSAHNAALVLTDLEEGPPQVQITADFAYVRIRREEERSEIWAEWAERLAALTRRGIDVYAFLKQDRKGAAVERARRLSTLLQREEAQTEQPLLT